MDITRDVMRLTAEGKGAVEIRRFVDAKYVKPGAPVRTPRPPER